MSFDQLSSLERGSASSRTTGYSDDPEFSRVASSLSSRLFTLTASITQLNRQLALVGTKKDSESLRDDIKARIENTRKDCKDVSEGVKRIQNWGDVSPSARYTQDKLSKQFTTLLQDFQAAQRLSAEKTRQYVAAARSAQHHLEDPSSPTSPHDQQQQLIPLVQEEIALADQGEVDFQDNLIQEREEEIVNIEQGINELNEIFRDLGTMVAEQDNSLQAIDANVSKVATDNREAERELRSASRYQKGARNRACCLLLILAVVLCVVLLAVLS